MPDDADDRDTQRSAGPLVGTSRLTSRLARALCVIVIAVMLISLVYGAWIALSNYSRIHE